MKTNFLKVKIFYLLFFCLPRTFDQSTLLREEIYYNVEISCLYPKYVFFFPNFCQKTDILYMYSQFYTMHLIEITTFDTTLLKLLADE